MDQNVFKIRKAFLVPFMATVVLLFLLLILSLVKGQSIEKFILTFAFVGTFAIGLEASSREITVTNDNIRIKKFFRVKSITWSDITHLGVVDLNKKAYFLITTTKGFYFFSNMFENHALLIQRIVDKLEDKKIETEVKNYLEHPSERHSLIVICWLTVLITIIFIILKLLSV